MPRLPKPSLLNPTRSPPLARAALAPGPRPPSPWSTAPLRVASGPGPQPSAPSRRTDNPLSSFSPPQNRSPPPSSGCLTHRWAWPCPPRGSWCRRRAKPFRLCRGKIKDQQQPWTGNSLWLVQLQICQLMQLPRLKKKKKKAKEEELIVFKLKSKWMHTWKVLAELYRDKTIFPSLLCALSLSLYLALPVCLKLLFVIFTISLFLSLTLKAYWATRWKDLPQVTLYLFIESESTEKPRVNGVYEISRMTGTMRRKKTTDDTHLVEKTGKIITRPSQVESLKRMREKAYLKFC